MTTKQHVLLKSMFFLKLSTTFEATVCLAYSYKPLTKPPDKSCYIRCMLGAGFIRLQNLRYSFDLLFVTTEKGLQLSW